jgi:sensor histidine kinase YesM
MAKNKKNRKLLFQIAGIVLPLFLLHLVAVVWLSYRNAVNGYLTAQNENIESDLEENYLNLVDNHDPETQKVSEWLLTYLENHADKEWEPLSEEEWLEFDEATGENKYWSAEWLNSLPEKMQYYAARIKFNNWKQQISFESESGHYEKLFLMDVSEGFKGMALCDYSAGNECHGFGYRYDLDADSHKALEKAIRENTSEIIYELSDDFSENKNCYIAYKPMVFSGKTKAVLCIAYSWDKFRSSITSNLKIVIILIIAGLMLTMAVLIFMLYRRAARPVVKIQRALLDYTEDKNTAKIVGKMFNIKERNEIGYLADVISDMSLEIDRYTKENLKVQKDLYDAKVQIMVSQIRPHFMYNALTSIAMMCELDPMTAKKATIAFADYLRGNMDSLKQTRPVPFETELEHLKNYLYIEKLRFDYLLNIEYDIQATGFELPLLSIQPLVENAVKHGVGMKKGGGTVKIASAETDSAFEVIVSDDGVGFDVNAPKKDDGRSHVGMENTKRRLKEMCKADIVITSEVGKGTTARVIIPKKEGKANEDTVS